MVESAHVVVLTSDARLAAAVGAAASSLGATHGDRSAANPSREAVVVDGREGSPDALLASRSDRRTVLWVTPEPRGAEAARALEMGAHEILGLPISELGVRSALKRVLTCASRGVNDERHDLSGDAWNRPDFRELLEAQAALMPLQPPEELLRRIGASLGRLFPGSRASVTELVHGEGVRDQGPQRWGEPDAWDRARVPLWAGDEVLGWMQIEAPEGQVFSRSHMELFEIFGREASQALHRSRLYEALSQGKAEWERTFDTIPDCILLVGPDRLVRRANRAAAASAGKEPKDLVGQPCFAVLHSRQEPCADCLAARALGTGQEARAPGPVVRGEQTYDYRAYPLRGSHGQVSAAILYARDITREENLTRSLRHSEKLVTLGQLAAGIAHEINTPLTAVSSYAQLLALRLKDPRDAESARHIQEGVDRIHQLVGNLMSFVRPSDEGFYPLDLNEIVAQALSFSRFELTRGETRLVEKLAPDLPKVLGSRDQLEQLFINLLTNARDAVAGRGSVTVATDAKSDRVLLVVSDDGMGIASQDLARVFDPFFTTKPRGQGTGLGLFIASGIARQHGGELAVSSEPGRGTRVELDLPAFRA